MNELRTGKLEDAQLEASKWLKSQVLIDEQEMSGLFAELSAFQLFYCGRVIHPGEEGEIAKGKFLEEYADYIACLKNGVLPQLSTYRQKFSPVLTVTTDVLYAVSIGEGRQIIRLAQPAIQLQAFNIGYSSPDQKFSSMVFGSDSIPWGIQFSYPQLCRNQETKEIEQTKHVAEFPNTHVFHVLQKWMRVHTVPTPFLIEDRLENYPARLGKKCFGWINHHPQLTRNGIRVNICA